MGIESRALGRLREGFERNGLISTFRVKRVARLALLLPPTVVAVTVVALTVVALTVVALTVVALT
jgi:hypothetical protein